MGGYEALAEHAGLVEGAWPDGGVGGGGTEVVVHERAAAILGLVVGDELRLVNARDDSVLTLRLCGTFRPADPGSGYWAGDPLGVNGTDRGGSFVTFGPFLAGAGVETQVADPALTWRADPTLEGLTPAEVDGLRGAVTRLLAGTLDVETDLDEVLDGVASPVAVARSAVGLALALVVLLGVTAALLVTRLVQEDRRLDVALRASRGFSPGQLRASHAVEAVVLLLPAAVLGPPLAWTVVRAVAATTATNGAGNAEIAAGTSLGRGAWLVAGVSALVVAGLLVRRPVAAADGSDAGTGPRGRVVAAWSRLGLDLVAVPLAVLAALQLLTYDVSTLAAGSDEALAGAGIDPVLALAVPVVVLAAALVVGRVLRGLLLLAARRAGRIRGPVTALSVWQLARRADEHRAMLVSTLLAAAVVTVAVVQGATYVDSQEAQARLAVAGDLRVAGLEDPAQGDEVVALVEELGGTAVVVLRERTSLGDLPLEVVALDTGRAADVLDRAAPDVTWSGLLQPLAVEVGSEAAGAALPAVVADAVAARAGDAGPGSAAGGRGGCRADGERPRRLPARRGAGRRHARLRRGDRSGRDGDGVLTDRAALERAVGSTLATGVETEVWAAVPRAAVGSLRSEVEGEGVRVADRWSATADRNNGPVGSGVRVALVLVVLVAAVLGVVGFVAAAAVGLRRRRPEVAALRATGLSRRQVTWSQVVERLGLLAVALLIGAGLGAAVGWVFSPRLVLTEAATVPVPPPRAGLDPTTAWSVGLVLVVLAAVCAAALWVLVARLVARPLSAELRAGEDT